MSGANVRSRYRAVLRGRFGAVLAASVLGRLHESMVSFGVVLLVTQSGTYARAGLVMAAYGAGGILAAPVTARLVDRHGNARVLLTTAALFAGALLAMGAAVDRPALPAIAALTGLVTPPLTPAVRAWLPRLVPDEHRATAFALESTLQEVIFVAGPVLAGVCATLLGAQAALAAAAAVTLAGTVASCVLMRGVVTVTAPRSERTSMLRAPGVLRLLVAGAGFLLPLSIAGVALVAAVSGPRAVGSAGLYLGLTSVGSMIGGLLFAARVRPGAPVAPRFLALAGALVVLAATAVSSEGIAGEGVAGSAVLLAAASFGYGLTIAPVATVVFARLSEVSSDARGTEAFGWMGAAMGVGGVLGDAAGGWLVTVAPAWAALLVAAAAASATAGVMTASRTPFAAPRATPPHRRTPLPHTETTFNPRQAAEAPGSGHRGVDVAPEG